MKAIAEGNKVEVLKTLKANGENVQVAYSAETQAWVVTSKNVALLARKKSEVPMYKDDRYKFAKEMADVWFDKLATMKPDVVKDLETTLSGRTLVGEYIGSDDHQHLVKYSRVSIIFYAVVDNYATDSCWPCEKAWALFNKFGLDKVHI